MSAVDESVALGDEVIQPSPVNENSKNPRNIHNKPGNSKGLLLRLFQSDLFTSTQAVYYLYKYSAEPGIQFYLCERLKDMPRDQIEFLLPQLW